MNDKILDPLIEGFKGSIRLHIDIVLAVWSVISAFVNNSPAPRKFARGDDRHVDSSSH